MRTAALAGLGVLLFCSSPVWAEDVFPESLAGKYRFLTCSQIVQEARSVSRKGFVLSGLQPGTGGTDNTATNSAVIIVWPALGNSSADTTAKLRYAAGQIDALEDASVASQCSIQFKRPETTPAR
jgi:hypothetical protein